MTQSPPDSRRPSTLQLPTTPISSRKPSTTHSTTSCLSSSIPTLKCNICHSVAFNSVLILCGHAFCWSCIYQWFETQTRNLRESSCPVCGSFASKTECIPIYNTFENVNLTDLDGNNDPEIPERPMAPRNYKINQSLRRTVFERLDNGIERAVEFIIRDPYAILDTITFVVHAFGLFLFDKIYDNLQPIDYGNTFQVDMLNLMKQFCIVLGLFPSMFLLHATALLFQHFVEFLHGFKKFFFFLCIVFGIYILLNIGYFVYKTFSAVKCYFKRVDRRQ